MSVTYAYCTARRDNRIEWFFDSLAKQVALPAHIIVVDHFADESGRKEEIFDKFAKAFTAPLHVEHEEKGNVPGKFFTHISPKPNVWQGVRRLTREDWFAMSNARNTVLCLCRTSHICYLDDLSVLMPGWWNAIQDAVAGNYVGCGAYRKVKNLVVENGEVKSFDPFSDDCRLTLAKDDVSPCTGDWLYGCSCVFPVEDLLEVGGWPEFCDGLGSEDTTLGIVLSNAGKHLKYDKRMMTLESEELHHYSVGSDSTWENGLRVSASMKRRDKGVSPNDKSHAIVNIARASKYFPNYYEGGMRALREHMLAGGNWPTAQIPDRDWFDNQLIAEME